MRKKGKKRFEKAKRRKEKGEKKRWRKMRPFRFGINKIGLRGIGRVLSFSEIP
jgi:hypothetical protein